MDYEIIIQVIIPAAIVAVIIAFLLIVRAAVLINNSEYPTEDGLQAIDDKNKGIDMELCAFWLLCPDCGAEAILDYNERFGPGIFLQCPNEDSDLCGHNIVYGLGKTDEESKEDAENQWREMCEV